MKNFLIGIVTGVVVCGLGLLIVFFIFVRIASSFSERAVTVADDSTLILKLEGDVPEKSPPEIPIPLFEQQLPMTVDQVWSTFRKAAADSRIKGIIFEPRGLALGWGKLEEIRAEIQQFRKSGKPIIAFLRNPGAYEYYLATATDRIIMAPDDMLDVKGLRLEATYFKDSLDKIGVKMDVVHAGKYKDAGDIFTQTAMSPETREVLTDVLNQYYGDLANTIADGRKKQSSDVLALIDQGPFLGSDALKDGLVDALGYDDQAEHEMTQRLHQSSLTKITGRAYQKVPWPAGAQGPRRIALVVGEGEITRGEDNNSGLGGNDGITSGGFIKLLKQVENDSTIKGVIIRVDSPGGDGAASDDILHAAKDLSKKKPVVISMSDLAASGGYFMSMTGDPVIAYPNTLTGSIGVIFMKPNIHGLFDKLGVKVDTLSRGRYSGLYSSYENPTPDEQQKLTSQIQAFYRDFLQRVADGRKRKIDDIEPLAQGRVWLGAQAKNNGLVDYLGGLDRAIELVKQRAQIPASEKITLVTYPPKRSVLDMLLNREESADIEAKISSMLGGVPVSAWVRGGFLKVMPYAISVR